MDDAEIAAEVAALKGEKATILTQLGNLAGMVQVSEQGRNFDFNGTRNSLQARLQAINERLVLLSPWELSEVRRC